MAGELVRVWTDVGARKPVPLLAKIEEKDGVIYTIRYLSEEPDHVWRYEEDTYDIDEDSIAEFLKSSCEEDVGFRPHEDGFVKMDSDEDYVPEEESSESDYSEESDEFEGDADVSGDDEDEDEDEEETLDEE
jgi:hypothetical protein